MPKTSTARGEYVSGHCGIGNHEICIGGYGGTKCWCVCDHPNENKNKEEVSDDD